MLSPAQKALIELLARRLIRDAIAERLAATQPAVQNRALPEQRQAS